MVKRMKIHSKRIEKKRLSDQIIENIVSLIMAGKLKPADKLPTEQQLTEEFGVGRSSLREAIGDLTLIGVLSVKPGLGTIVSISPERFLAKPLSWGMMATNPQSFKELSEVRLMLEVAAAGLAAENADNEEISQLRSYLEELRAKKGNLKKRVQIDMAFHKALVEASHNSVLLRFYSEIQQLLRFWIQESAQKHDNDLFLEQHDQILRSIERHHVEKAKLMMRAHIEFSASELDYALLGRKIKLSFGNPPSR